MLTAALHEMLVPRPLVADADQEVSDTEIRIGNIMPYTGPLAAFATIEKPKRPISI
jgi:branched-chain amino acid transport system substrate-binding protein